MQTLLLDQVMLNLDNQEAPVAYAKLNLPIALIPAYKPEKVLCSIARDVIAAGAVQAVIVVNDGSPAEYDSIFAELSGIPGVHVVSHHSNQGKGAALKTGFLYIADSFPKSMGVVTADADGQHDPLDINKIALELAQAPKNIILGARTFKGSVPMRSRFGNELTRHILSLFSDQKIQDTQTGLRGIPAHLISVFTKLRPNGYDYELDMLITSNRLGGTIKEVAIRTIYINNNESSHFRPIRDSLRIYSVFLKFAATSLLTALMDNIIFIVSFWLGGNLLLSQISGRVSALLFNYFANKNAVFHSQTRMLTSAVPYLALASFLLMTSYCLIYVAVYKFNMSVLVAKISIESLLFFLSFLVQKLVVFRAHKRVEASA